MGKLVSVLFNNLPSWWSMGRTDQKEENISHLASIPKNCGKEDG
jgi:hypothetical protein